MIRKFITIFTFAVLAFILNLPVAKSAMVEWSWDYGTEEPTIIFLLSSSSFDIHVKITNEPVSDRAIYIAPYAVPDGYYYEGFYEFQSNVSEVVNEIIQPGETSFLKLGTWVPVVDGPAPYVNIQAQPKYLEIYYFDDNGSTIVSGQDSLNPLELRIFDAIDFSPYDPNNPGQGVIISWLPPETISTPIPSSILVFTIGLMGLVSMIRRKQQII